MGLDSKAWKEKGAATDGRRPFFIGHESVHARRFCRSPDTRQGLPASRAGPSEGVVRLRKGDPLGDQRFNSGFIVSGRALDEAF